MKVSYVSITRPIDNEFMTPEQLIVYIARVSNPSHQSDVHSSDRLLRYLIDNKHWSPFEMVDMTVEITTSRAIAHQLIRHRSFSFQEFSQRYAKVGETTEMIECRKAGSTNRQSSTEPIDLDDDMIQRIHTYQTDGMELYQDMIKSGVANECARFILPLNTQTRLYMKGSVRSWIHYLQVRMDEHTQKEHRDIANAIAMVFQEQFPLIYSYILVV